MYPLRGLNAGGIIMKLVVGSTLILAVMGCAMKATAGMRGQTVRELVRGDRH